MPGVYYPLTATRATVKPPKHEAYVIPSDDGSLYAVQSGSQFEILDEYKTMQFITSLPRGAWVISYDTSTWITVMFSNNLDVIKRVETVAEFQSTSIETDYIKVFIIDLFQATNETLFSAARKLNAVYTRIEDSLTDHLRSKLSALITVWYKYIDATGTAWGVFPSKTTGATALKSWRATIPEDKEYRVRGRKINQLARQAIRPGGLNWKEGYYPQGVAYDINGSYINAMRTIKLPTRVTCFANRPATGRWIATVKLNYKSNLHWGVLPVRSSTGKLYRPMVMEDYTTTITYLDFYLLQLTGEVEIVQWLEGINWQAEHEEYLFESWINGLITASKEPDNKYLLKNVSRALHSKFAQNQGGSFLYLLRPKDKQEVMEYAARKELQDIIFTNKGGIVIQVKQPYPKHFVPFIFPHWEALILAAGRLQLYTSIDQNTIYVDTDSIISTAPRHDLPLSNEYGNWKQEAEGQTAIIGARAYLCGNKIRCSGVRANSKEELKNALISATRGVVSEVQKIEYGNIVKQTRTEYKQHTIKIEKYPYVELYGNKMYVTASPTVEVDAVISPRLFSIDKHSLNLL